MSIGPRRSPVLPLIQEESGLLTPPQISFILDGSLADDNCFGNLPV